MFTEKYFSMSDEVNSYATISIDPECKQNVKDNKGSMTYTEYINHLMESVGDI